MIVLSKEQIEENGRSGSDDGSGSKRHTGSMDQASLYMPPRPTVEHENKAAHVYAHVTQRIS